MGRWPALAVLYTATAVAVFWPALAGPFLSDDHIFIVQNDVVHELSWANLVAILDPGGEPARDTANWAPVHLLAVALTWQLFGTETLGHHALNVALHVVGCLLVAALLMRSLPPAFAAVAGLLFLVHPANVEAVAWIFQLKTLLAFVSSTGALVLLARGRPGWATTLFALALLAKASALAALPAAAALHATRSDLQPRERRSGWLWLAGWAALLALYALPQLGAFERTGAAVAAPEGGARLLQMLAIGARYLWLALSGLGASAFHDPDPPRSFFDAWALAGVLCALGLAARIAVVARRRSPELAFWLWAAAGWAPISQLFPFSYPMGDRYLYFVLPGLIGGASLAALEAWTRLASWRPALAAQRRIAARVAAAAALGMCALFAATSVSRARIWRSDVHLLIDSARHYPEGRSASLLEARAAARRGDVEGVERAFRSAMARGFDHYPLLFMDPALASVRGSTRFQALMSDMAGVWLERNRARPHATAGDHRMRGQAHLVRREYREAVAELELALELGAEPRAAIESELRDAREALRRSSR